MCFGGDPGFDVHCLTRCAADECHGALASVPAHNFQAEGRVGGLTSLARMHARARDEGQREVRPSAEFCVCCFLKLGRRRPTSPSSQRQRDASSSGTGGPREVLPRVLRSMHESLHRTYNSTPSCAVGELGRCVHALFWKSLLLRRAPAAGACSSSCTAVVCTHRPDCAYDYISKMRGCDFRRRLLSLCRGVARRRPDDWRRRRTAHSLNSVRQSDNNPNRPRCPQTQRLSPHVMRPR